jgi:hypothetical protein
MYMKTFFLTSSMKFLKAQDVSAGIGIFFKKVQTKFFPNLMLNLAKLILNSPSTVELGLRLSYPKMIPESRPPPKKKYIYSIHCIVKTTSIRSTFTPILKP